MYFQFLIEDQSSEVLINIIMKKIISIYPQLQISYDSKSFRGIGGFTKKNMLKDTKTGNLLNDLATYLRGFNKSLQGIEAAIFVVLDNDKRDTSSFYEQLEKVALENNISIDHVFCIAVEEVEAWLLGDEVAISEAYPKYKSSFLKKYVQDSVCGTWEVLANVVYPGGIEKIRKNNYSYMIIGTLKSEWAKNIGLNMNIFSNNSPSFNHFISEIKLRLDIPDAINEVT